MAFCELNNYLRTFRKRSGFSQRQVAFLLGCDNNSKVCKHERLGREPSLRTALAYEIIFKTPVRKLFAGIYSEIERDVRKRLKKLAHGRVPLKARRARRKKQGVKGKA